MNVLLRIWSRFLEYQYFQSSVYFRFRFVVPKISTLSAVYKAHLVVTFNLEQLFAGESPAFFLDGEWVDNVVSLTTFWYIWFAILVCLSCENFVLIENINRIGFCKVTYKLKLFFEACSFYQAVDINYILSNIIHFWSLNLLKTSLWALNISFTFHSSC